MFLPVNVVLNNLLESWY